MDVLALLPSFWVFMPCLILVSGYAWYSFDVWSESTQRVVGVDLRPSWVAERRVFLSWRLAYVCCYVLGLAVAVSVPIWVAKVLPSLADGSAYSWLMFFSHSSPLWGSLLLVAVVPAVPRLARADETLRERFHHHAAVPEMVLRTVNRLVADERCFQPRDRIVEMPGPEGSQTTLFAVAEDHDGDDPLLSQWFKVRYLWAKLRQWMDQDRTAEIPGELVDRMGVLFDRCEALQPEIAAYTAARNMAGSEAVNIDYADFVRAMRAGVRARVEGMLRDIYAHVYAAIMTSCSNPAARRSAFVFFDLAPDLAFAETSRAAPKVLAVTVVVGVTLAPVWLMGQWLNLPAAVEIGFLPVAANPFAVWAAVVMGACALAVATAGLLRPVIRDQVTGSRRRSWFGHLAGGERLIVGGTLAGMGVGFEYLFFALAGVTGLAEALYFAAWWALLPAAAALVSSYLAAVLDYTVRPPGFADRIQFGVGAALLMAVLTVIVGLTVARPVLFWDLVWVLTGAVLSVALFGVGVVHLFVDWHHYQAGRERRRAPRFPVRQFVTVSGDDGVADCQTVDVSITGLCVDMAMTQPLGSLATVELPGIGTVQALVVRKTRRSTGLCLIADTVIREQLGRLLQDHGFISEPPALAA